MPLQMGRGDLLKAKRDGFRQRGEDGFIRNSSKYKYCDPHLARKGWGEQAERHPVVDLWLRVANVYQLVSHAINLFMR